MVLSNVLIIMERVLKVLKGDLHNARPIQSDDKMLEEEFVCIVKSHC